GQRRRARRAAWPAPSGCGEGCAWGVVVVSGAEVVGVESCTRLQPSSIPGTGRGVALSGAVRQGAVRAAEGFPDPAGAVASRRSGRRRRARRAAWPAPAGCGEGCAWGVVVVSGAEVVGVESCTRLQPSSIPGTGRGVALSGAVRQGAVRASEGFPDPAVAVASR